MGCIVRQIAQKKKNYPIILKQDDLKYESYMEISGRYTLAIEIYKISPHHVPSNDILKMRLKLAQRATKEPHKLF
jgi:hypothetical protein